MRQPGGQTGVGSVLQTSFGDLVSQQPPLRVITDYGEIGKGASKAHTVRCENGAEYLTKGPTYVPDHPMVAANELICVRLARQMGLPVLDFDVAELNGELFFASRRMVAGTFHPQIDPALLARCVNRDRVYDVVVFDAWVCNRDRHHENLVVRQPKPTPGGELLLLNDHSHCPVYPPALVADLPSLVPSPISAYSAHLAFVRDAITDLALLDVALTSAESISDAMINAIVAAVPERLLPVPDRVYYTTLLNGRRPLLRTLFASESHIFPNLK